MHQHAGVFLPLEGPWIIVQQNQQRAIEKLTWAQACSAYIPVHRLDVSWGEVAYQLGTDGKPEVAAFYIDSSD